MFLDICTRIHLYFTTLFSRLAASRDVQHFLAAFVSTLLPLLFATSQPLTAALILAAIPGAATVAFRTAFPNPVEQAVKILGGDAALDNAKKVVEEAHAGTLPAITVVPVIPAIPTIPTDPVENDVIPAAVLPDPAPPAPPSTQ